MKAIFFPIMSIFLLLPANIKPQTIERVKENGVEIVKNSLQPAPLSKHHFKLTLEDEFAIDSSNMEIARIGLYDILDFVVDSKGWIYLMPNVRTFEQYIYAFNSEGRFLRAFFKRGEGPGETSRGTSSVAINHRDEIEAWQVSPYRLSVFRNDGKLLREKTLTKNFTRLYSLPNGKYLAYGPAEFSRTDVVQTPLVITDADFRILKLLDQRQEPNASGDTRMKFSPMVFQWSISKDRIFIGNELRGYEILVYDFEGRLVRKVQKKYSAVKISANIIEKFKKKSRFANRVFFPDDWPAFQGLFSDENGRLFVATFEPGPKPGEFIHDVFDMDGAFIGRVSLAHFMESVIAGPVYLTATAKNQRLYLLQESENGYKRLSVSHIYWK